MTLPPETLARQALDHVLLLPGQRKLIAIAGPPGSGKSTVAEVLNRLLREAGKTSAVVPMDGFHLDNAVLDARCLRKRKGAPETFDGAGFCNLVKRIATEGADIVYPVFDRSRDIAIAGAAVLSKDVEYVLFEGNYLALDAEPWRQLAQFWTSSIWINAPIDELERRLMQRWFDEGLSEADARIKVGENDLPNAKYVQANSRTCDLVL
jgi:pantothenate kinase